MSDDGPANAGGTPAPPEVEGRSGTKPRRKKRRRRVGPDTPAPPQTDQAAAETDEPSPAFARARPRDPALDALVAAFEAGEYARVRREAPELARRTESDAVRRAARELRRRLDPDPVAVYMLMAAAALLVFLAGWYWLHPHIP